MHIKRLRLLGFKSFVEPTELVIDQGLTGVVGPNGCGKSNLLEALRWVMGETSHKSMRAASMDDVIFSGTSLRPARNMAEVTIFIDNAARSAPAEFNDQDTLEVTRRIEREAGSAYRINGRESRARDVKILFEDAATGARSPALVRQGQIAEIVNAKPEHRRRILEDAAGVAGLHSRRHEAELRLKAADANLARLSDILGQMTSQIESLKRQARQARRYKELSIDIRRTEALLAHLSWVDVEAAVVTEEAALAASLTALGLATQEESQALRLEAERAEALPALREAEGAAGAVLHRIKLELENFEREAKRAADRQRELEGRAEQSRRDIEREQALVGEAEDTLKRLAAEQKELVETNALATDFERKALEKHDAVEAEVNRVEARVSELTTAVAEGRARRSSLEQRWEERRDLAAKIKRQLAALEQQLIEIGARAPDADKLRTATELSQQLVSDQSDIETRLIDAEDRLRTAAIDAQSRRLAAQEAVLAASRVRTEIETLTKVLKPASDSAFTPVLDQVRVTEGYELALATALGDDLDAPADDSAPVHWLRIDASGRDPSLPAGVAPLSDVVEGPIEITRRLAQIGVVDRAQGASLQAKLATGQRLVSVEGDLWRWDGFVAAAHGVTAAAVRLSERNRLDMLTARGAELDALAARAQESEAATSKVHAEAEGAERQLRQQARETQSKIARTRELLTVMERQARETETRFAQVTEARDVARESLTEAEGRAEEAASELGDLPELAPFETELATLQMSASEQRRALAEARVELTTLEREHRLRTERLATIATERARWAERTAGAKQQIATLEARAEETRKELSGLTDLPALIEEQRSALLDRLSDAEKNRNRAADTLAAADTAHREAASAFRAQQAAVVTAREARARIEAKLEAVRTRRTEESRRIQETLECRPDQCLQRAGLAAEAALPSLADTDRQLQRLRADRERLGGVNLEADNELTELQQSFDTMETERRDVEEAIAKLRGAIAQLNKEAKARLDAAFESVNGHFVRLFTTLFGGGEARLEMIESAEDPLEGGLEIVAKPPGKKPATLSLLSGGEQTLTALSLIFAVFLTNPSPICVLDEVDAPLDDANIDRFCTLMEAMARDTATRFLVITHHPMTMARMNRLFGVTMGEKGVSQLVSVDLEAARKIVETEAA
jgi:chromosome segregation protein